jgi:hypothetical protein
MVQRSVLGSFDFCLALVAKCCVLLAIDDWNVYSAWDCETDIAILHLDLFKRSDPETIIEWRTPLI